MSVAPRKTPGNKGNRSSSGTTSKKGAKVAPYGTSSAKLRQAIPRQPQASRLSSGQRKAGGK
jgi:hypothetical protein